VTYLQLAHQTGFSRGSATSNSFNCASDHRHLNDTAPFRRQSSLDNVFFPDSAVFFPDSATRSSQWWRSLRHFVLPRAPFPVAMMNLIGGQRSFTVQPKPIYRAGRRFDCCGELIDQILFLLREGHRLHRGTNGSLTSIRIRLSAWLTCRPNAPGVIHE
jgi:hypothetical protein